MARTTPHGSFKIPLSNFGKYWNLNSGIDENVI
jgi:hypothetical protein